MVTEHPGIVAALVAFQAALPNVGKTSTAQYGNYADLADVSAIVLPRLAAVGICYTARPTFDETGGPVLVAQLRHTSGEEITAEWRLVPAGPQQMGSQITYARRYCLLAMCGVHPQGEDDDAQAAHKALAKDTVATTKKATRARTTRDQDDEWTGPPITHTPPPRKRSGAEQRSAEQSTAIFTILGHLGLADPDRGRVLIGRLAGRDRLESSKDLTRAEATVVIDALKDIQSQPDPAAAIAGILGIDDQEFQPRPVVDVDSGGRT